MVEVIVMRETEDLRNLLARAKEEGQDFYVSSLENMIEVLLEKVDRLTLENQELKRGELVLDDYHLRLFEEAYLTDPDNFSEEKIASYLLVHDEFYRITFEELLVYGFLRKPARESVYRLYTIPNEKKMKLLAALKKRLPKSE